MSGTSVLYDVEHITTYNYSQGVTVSHHSAHLRPRSFATQDVIETELRASPLPEIRAERTDYFGNTVTSFSLSRPHEALTIISRCRVRVHPPDLPDPADTPPWEEVAQRLRRGFGADTLDACTVLHDSFYVRTLGAVAEYARPSFPPGRPILEAGLDLTRRLHRDFAYDPSATTIATPLAEVLRNRRGVCQDFAHLQIACFRAMGLAARYVSGYILTHPPEGGPALEGGDASHAWVALFVPCPNAPNGGWIGLDPTNDKVVTREHITVAWGRDFEDVSPVKGVMLGGGAQRVGVSVRVSLLSPCAPRLVASGGG
ncbi:transglutaminase family protein [Pararhodospirillum photometricum]|uniref:Transglutaminase-like n=1 Tax=Pararhodospirillum photometricum DSM 122 TaxID=1150469 RepID=H6SQW4_PARPM|nr:transglutaminase family protein [Pararhodospirillum photometricum]CCG07429.1 Transglutaminase-like [Pararhodospirillum photometricum DSM 122]